jgi:hypothetical protein
MHSSRHCQLNHFKARLLNKEAAAVAVAVAASLLIVLKVAVAFPAA